MSAERKEALMKMDMEQATQDLVAALTALGAQGYYVPVFVIKGNKIYTQEIGNVNPRMSSSLLMYLLDQKAQEALNHGEKGKRTCRSRRH